MTQPNHSTAGSPASLPEQAVDGQGRDGSSPLLGLTSSNAKTAEIREVLTEESNPDRRDPLLGTSYSQSIENARGSSERWSPGSICYEKLLHTSNVEGAGVSQKPIIDVSCDCYTNMLHTLPTGVSIRGSTFYHRRRLPSDIRPLTGKSEVWRSLRTDSSKMAMRRLPQVAARIEAEIEYAAAAANKAAE